MTLVQVLADRFATHLACDFRLTDVRTGAPVQENAHKLLRVGCSSPVLVAVTGSIAEASHNLAANEAGVERFWP